MFFEEISSLLESLSAENLLITGDFNIHLDIPEDRDTITFLNILDIHNLQQHITEPTHIAGHMLDLLISRIDSDLVTSHKVEKCLPSDHFAIKCNVKIIRPGPCTKRVKSRLIRNIIDAEFRQDIQSSLETMSSVKGLEEMISGYNNTLSNTLDVQAPEVDRTVILRPHAPWYTDSLRAAKQERRRRERKWLQTDLTVHKELYEEQCEEYKLLLERSKTEYHSNQVTEANQRDLFRVVDKLSTPKSTCNLPDHEDAKDLANSFAKFLSDKINKLRNGLDANSTSSISVQLNESCDSSLCDFTTVSEEDVLKVIKSSSITSCPLDPSPASVFRLCRDDLLPVITIIVNESLSSGVFPASLKCARIVPLLKKPSLDHNILSNYRPISNLPYLGKVIERIAVQQLQSYLIENHLHAQTQAAYRPFHSVETALLKVQNDILTALDKRKEAWLVLLDFSAGNQLDITGLVRGSRCSIYCLR
ncbi:uncharacterized protein [Amphiura filiformis]|uniref:uncharacterized protein n=1 Tax=Amphiura filiformis TaxID=82378 RepID=UPI003B2146A8